MATRASIRRAFTLIELLVVIAIIAVLISLLTPLLARAKQITRKLKCAVNLRQTGTGMHGFASEHESRFPGKAHSTVEYWSPAWMQILNREFYHNNDQSYYPTSAYGDEPTCGPLLRFWTFWHPDYYDNSQLHTKWMTCTEFNAWGSYPGTSNIWCRPWMMNRNANGGASWSPYPWEGTYGKLLPDPRAIHPNYDRYALGTVQDRFRSSSEAFLVWEGERGSDITNISSNVSGGTPPLDADPSRPPWTSYYAYWSFRHMLPRDREMYDVAARAHVLYVDGHVGELEPKVPYALARHYLLDG